MGVRLAVYCFIKPAGITATKVSNHPELRAGLSRAQQQTRCGRHDISFKSFSQVIDIRIPASLKPTVADAMRYALKQSGYTLCATGPANGVLYRQPLPAVQYQTGPVRLRSALQMMAGPAWQLEVDDVQRVVCHSLREGYQLPARQLAPVPAVVKVSGAEQKK